MDDDLPPLGPGKAWLVKDFPVSLREDITRAAAGQGVTVAAWLVAHFQKHGVGGVEVTRVYPTPVNPGNGPGTAPVLALPAPAQQDFSDLGQFAAMAKDLAAAEAAAPKGSRAKGIVNRFSAVVQSRLDLMPGAPKRGKPVKPGEPEQPTDGQQDTA